MSGFKCRMLMERLNEVFVEFHDVKATMELVAMQEFFLYMPTHQRKFEWMCIIEDRPYIVWFDGSFYVKEK